MSYNLKKLVEAGYMHHQKCNIDRRAVRVKLTDKGRQISGIVAELFERHGATLEQQLGAETPTIRDINVLMRRLERFWGDQIRYIY